MVYRVALRFSVFEQRDQFVFAILSGLFFILYPFHNESVAWITGRLSSIACLSALLIIYWSMNYEKSRKYLVYSFLVFLFGLTGYESIIVIPLVLLIWNWKEPNDRQREIVVFFSWICVTLLYIILRYVISGGITSDYGSRIYTQISLSAYLEKFFKTAARLLLPPSENPSLMTMLFISACLILAALQFVVLKKIKGTSRKLLNRYMVLILALVISLLLPASFGVSTRTSEGDRLLYFPSVFICLIISFWVILLTGRMRVVYSAAVCFYFIFFLVKNNRKWEFASAATDNILNAARNAPEKIKVFINLPGEMDGSFIFREGFHEALRVLDIDSTKIKTVSYLTRPDHHAIKGTIAPEYKDGVIKIFPATSIVRQNGNWLVTNIQSGNRLIVDTSVMFLYWDKETMKRLFTEK
jgi:hypothetical protein